MTNIKISSTDNVNELQVYIWEPENKPSAILQISHGMQEHIGRYEEFATFLNSKGVLVIGNDHLGHGYSAKDENDLGYFGANRSQTVVDDLHAVTLFAKEKYGNDVPFFLFGHSMGSFMARRYLMTYGGELTGAILSGTGSQPGLILSCGLLIANLTALIKGERHRSTLLKNMAFSSYNKRIKNPVSKSDWLSKDSEIVAKYDNDKFCTFDFTVNGYKTLFEAINFIQKNENIERIPKNLPILIMSGDEDPVGNYGKGVKMVYDRLKKSGLTNVDITLYEGGRHEMLNEVEREKVFDDIIMWINKHI